VSTHRHEYYNEHDRLGKGTTRTTGIVVQLERLNATARSCITSSRIKDDGQPHRIL
jgi:hypothetical protein